MARVRSSHLRTVTFNAKKKELDISFKNGSLYRYSDVETAEHRALMRAASHGKAFWRGIRDAKPFDQLVKGSPAKRKRR